MAKSARRHNKKTTKLFLQPNERAPQMRFFSQRAFVQPPRSAKCSIQRVHIFQCKFFTTQQDPFIFVLHVKLYFLARENYHKTNKKLIIY